jgi:hypothetical protein
VCVQALQCVRYVYCRAQRCFVRVHYCLVDAFVTQCPVIRLFAVPVVVCPQNVSTACVPMLEEGSVFVLLQYSTVTVS